MEWVMEWVMDMAMDMVMVIDLVSGYNRWKLLDRTSPLDGEDGMVERNMLSAFLPFPSFVGYFLPASRCAIVFGCGVRSELNGYEYGGFRR